VHRDYASRRNSQELEKAGKSIRRQREKGETIGHKTRQEISEKPTKREI
jgi:hypothetical protein